MKIRAFREECPFFIVENRFLKRNNRFFEGEALTVAKAASPSSSPLATLIPFLVWLLGLCDIKEKMGDFPKQMVETVFIW